jgi:hypothetical protein
MPGRILLTAAAGLAVALLMAGDSPHAGAPQYNTKGELQFPADYREWVFLSSGLGMSYGSGTPNAEDPPFDNVFVLPSAYKAFLETGRWPDQTVFILEVRASTSNGSINKAGHFQSERRQPVSRQVGLLQPRKRSHRRQAAAHHRSMLLLPRRTRRGR